MEIYMITKTLKMSEIVKNCSFWVINFVNIVGYKKNYLYISFSYKIFKFLI